MRATNAPIRLALLLALAVVCAGCTRGPAPASPQSGPLVGAWIYTGDDAAADGTVRKLVVGDTTWHVPKEIEFRADGTLNSAVGDGCHYWIQGPERITIDCGYGKGEVGYMINDGMLALVLAGQNVGLISGETGAVYERREVR
jgi:hypothetical protein